MEFVHQKCIREWVLSNMAHTPLSGVGDKPILACPTCKVEYRTRVDFTAPPITAWNDSDGEDGGETVARHLSDEGWAVVLARPISSWMWGLELPPIRGLQRREPQKYEELSRRSFGSATVLLLHVGGLVALLSSLLYFGVRRAIDGEGEPLRHTVHLGSARPELRLHPAGISETWSRTFMQFQSLTLWIFIFHIFLLQGWSYDWAEEQPPGGEGTHTRRLGGHVGRKMPGVDRQGAPVWNRKPISCLPFL